MQVVICQQRLVEKDMSEGDMDQLKSMSPMVSISIVSNISIIQQLHIFYINIKEKSYYFASFCFTYNLKTGNNSPKRKNIDEKETWTN